MSVAQSPPSPEHRAASVRAALARGDLLGAYDEVVRRGTTDHQDLNYLEVLTLAREDGSVRDLEAIDGTANEPDGREDVELRDETGSLQE